MWETMLVVQLTLIFNNGGQLIQNPPHAYGPYKTIEECRDEYVKIKERADATVQREPFLKGIKIDWGCITQKVAGQDI